MGHKRPLVIGNWKMNLDFVEAIHLGQQIGVVLKNKPLEYCDLVVAVPFVDLRSVSSIIVSERIAVGLGAQHVNAHENGAHTGEVSVAMLKRLNVEWVIVGHSERRAHYAMDDVIVEATLRTVLRAGLNAVLCVGEGLDVRESDAHERYVGEQLESALSGLDPHVRELVHVAYEPVWAIGTGVSASSEQVAAMTSFIRGRLAGLGLLDTRVLYGGSLNADNAATLMVEGGADGFLVGGASLKAESFMAIATACDDCYAGNR